MQEARINFVIETFANAIVEAGNLKTVPAKKVEGVSVAEFFQKTKTATEKKSSPQNKISAPVTNQPAQQEISQPQQNIPAQPDNTKKFLIGVICILAVALFLVIGNNSKTEPEVSELSLNGVELGMTESEVTKILGQPTNVNYYDDSYWYGYGEEENKGLGVGFLRKNGKVYCLGTQDSKFQTKRGIHIGSTYREMMDAYENNCEFITHADLDIYESYFKTSDGRRGTINFGVLGGRVIGIIVRYDD